MNTRTSWNVLLGLGLTTLLARPSLGHAQLLPEFDL